MKSFTFAEQLPAPGALFLCIYQDPMERDVVDNCITPQIMETVCKGNFSQISWVHAEIFQIYIVPFGHKLCGYHGEDINHYTALQVHKTGRWTYVSDLAQEYAVAALSPGQVIIVSGSAEGDIASAFGKDASGQLLSD